MNAYDLQVTVALVPVTAENWRSGVDVRATAEQQPFVAGHEPVLLLIMAKAFVRVGGLDWRPLLVQDEGRTVGVVALVDDRDRRREMAVLHLLVDRREQRRGHGRAAMRELVALADSTPDCDRLRLTVHPQNHSALALYESEGFEAHGHDQDGELRMTRPTVTA